jgi:hypothetical protein
MNTSPQTELPVPAPIAIIPADGQLPEKLAKVSASATGLPKAPVTMSPVLNRNGLRLRNFWKTQTIPEIRTEFFALLFDGGYRRSAGRHGSPR